MKKTLLALTLTASAFAQAPAADPVVITIGSEKLTQSMFENIIASLSEQQRAQLAAPEARRGLAEQISELKMMAQEARVRRLDQNPAMQMKIVLQAESMLAQAAYQDMLKSPPSDADLQAYYTAHQTEWSEAKGRHILIRFEGSRVPARDGKPELTEAQALVKAQEVRAKLVAGASFADTAKVESDDVGSGENGGDLGSFGPGQMVEEFDKAAFAVEVGKVTEPIKTAFGYHLILIESRGAKNFDEVKETIIAAMQPELGAKAVEALKAKAGIVINDEYFKVPPAPLQ
jgi:peptidyl-prolyl cis-trans isomerase C